MTENIQEPLDAARWEKLRSLEEATGQDFLSEVIDLYLTDAPQRLAELRGALAERDAARAEQLAHSLKGSSSNIGAPIVGAAAAELEARLAQGSFDGVDDLFVRLESEVKRVRQALAELRSPS